MIFDDCYRLDDQHRPVKCPPMDLDAWAEWSKSYQEHKHVAETTVGRFWVSTIFLGKDHNWSRRGPGLFFETMVFRTDDDGDRSATGEQWRFATWDDAVAGHATAVRRCERIERQEAKP
jgi:hypothetical protein